MLASYNQGHQRFLANGRQCMANSVQSIITATEQAPSTWKSSTLDSILENGDKLYFKISKNSSYLCVDDIPAEINSTKVQISEPVHGTLTQKVSDVSFCTLEDALQKLSVLNEPSGYIFTMGLSSPYYSGAIIKEGDNFFFFDPHSRSDTGMLHPDGHACLTSHKNQEALCLFLRHLSATLNCKNAHFELAALNLFISDNSSESEFSGFDSTDEKKAEKKLLFAQQKLSEKVDISDISDKSSDCVYFSENSDTESLESCHSTPTSLNSVQLEEAVSGLNDSSLFLQNIDVESFTFLPSENTDVHENADFLHVGSSYDGNVSADVDSLSDYECFDDLNDKNYEPSGSSDDDNQDDDDDDIPLAHYFKRRRFSKCKGTNVSTNKSRTANNHKVDSTLIKNSKTQSHNQDRDRAENDIERDGESVCKEVEVEVDITSSKIDSVEGSDILIDSVATEVGSTVEREYMYTATRVQGTEPQHSITVDRTFSVVEGCQSDNLERHRFDREGGIEIDQNIADRVEEAHLDRSAASETNKRGRSRVNIQEIKKGRKRKRDPSNWQRNISKQRKNSGLDYYSNYNKKLYHAKVMKEGCGHNCRYKCKTKFTHEDREMIFHSFWRLGDSNKQWQFQEKYAVKNPKASRKCNTSNHRKSSIHWSFPSPKSGTEQVCKTFFLATLSISQQMVMTAHNKLNMIGVCENDKRGSHNTRPNKISEDHKEKVRNHIGSFKAVESHYCRKDTKKQYLPAGLNVEKMHRMYCEECKEADLNPVSVGVYRNIFDNDFNLGFHKPIKDMCDFCARFRNASAIEKEKMKMQYERHLFNKSFSRQEKERIKTIVQSGNESELVAACFDLEQVLVTPRSFESCLYYKRRLNTYNLTVYDLGTGDGQCYIWNESIASRGSNEIASCLYSFIKQKAEIGKKKFVFFSDNCCGQNKNKNYVAMLWYCLQKFRLTSIEHKYLEKGHTQNENDSVHAAIESAAKDVSIYTTSQWAATIRTARHKNPYKVNELNVSDFFDFKAIASNLKNFTVNEECEKVRWNEIKTLCLSITEPEIFSYQLDYNGQVHSVNLFQRQRSKVKLSDIKLQRLHPDGIPIARAKYFDLLTLCRSGIIPSIHHISFLLLPYESE